MGEITQFVELYIEDSDILPKRTYEIARTLQNQIKKEAPYDQGRLKRSIRVDTRITDKYSIITGYWDEGIAPHGKFVLSGHRHPKKDGSFTLVPPNDFLGRGLLNTIALYG